MGGRSSQPIVLFPVFPTFFGERLFRLFQVGSARQGRIFHRGRAVQGILIFESAHHGLSLYDGNFSVNGAETEIIVWCI